MNWNSAGLADLSSNDSSRSEHLISRANCPSRLHPRFLCVSNGYEIFCLDLNAGKQPAFSNFEEIPLIPRIGTIELMRNALPVSVGLFRLGSQIYIIGGQKFQVSKVEEPHAQIVLKEIFRPSNNVQKEKPKFVLKENTRLAELVKRRENPLLSKGFFHLGPDLYRIDVKPDNKYVRFSELWGGDPKGVNLYRSLCERCKVKPSSCDIYAVSLAEGTLLFSGSDIAPLEKPKLWPIVETIDGQTHVIDTVPLQLTSFCSDWISSHEVLGRDNKSWSKILFKENMDYITSHLVLGSRIYVKAGESRSVFDSETGEWDAPKEIREWKNPYSVKTVWGILHLGIGRCAGGVVYGEPKNPLCVVIALVEDRRNYNACTVLAIAYLVTLDGLVVCWQLLSDFFEGPVKPSEIEGGTIIDVDENGLTLCSIISGSGNVPRSSEYVYINAFTTKGFTEAKSVVQRVWEKGENAWPVEQDFVRLEFKNRYVYGSHDGVESSGMLGVRACFFP